MSSVQIPVELLENIYSLLCYVDRKQLLPHGQKLFDSVSDGVNTKFDAIKKRNAFTAYKTAPDSERNERRKEYVQLAEIRS